MIKKILRKVYYMLFHGKETNMKGYEILKNKKWIIDENFGMAYYKGYYEPTLTKFIIENLNPDSVFVDIGSHAGYFSLIAKSVLTKGKVISFEPVPYNFNNIKTIKEINKLENWSVINKALGSSVGTVHFDSGSSSSTGHISESGGITVSVDTLNNCISELNTTKISMMKIDVEGYGGEVIKGGLETIKKFKPTILFEIHENSTEKESIIQHLLDVYNVYDFDTMKLIDLSAENPNFVLLRQK